MLLSPLQYNGAYYARIIWEYLGKRWQRCSPVPTGLLLRLCGQFLQFAATPKIALGFRSLVLEILEGSTEVELQKHLTSCIVFPQVTWPLDKSLFCLLLLRIDCTHTHSPKLQIQPARSCNYIQLWALYCFFFLITVTKYIIGSNEKKGELIWLSVHLIQTTLAAKS